MGMIKVLSPSGWDFGVQPVSLVKVASTGLRGADRTAFLKRASHSFLPFLDQVKFAEDEEPVHLIALGASEAYGPNRNGDAFKEAALKRYHDTFVKFARWYRNHKNKEPERSYGVVKLSAYNPAMRRAELLVLLNKTAAAAERNGGLVADRELEKLARGEDIPVSMACRVPYDVCAGCGNRARTREEYCKAANCRYGGCADNLTKLIKAGGDIEIAHVLNDHPAFFDISNVFRPADRIAYGNRADWLQKAASADGFFGDDGVKLAAELSAPLSVIVHQDTMQPGQWNAHVTGQLKLAHGLAAMEESSSYRLGDAIKLAFTSEIQPALDFAKLGLDTDHPVKTAAALGALADCRIILSLREFARLTKADELTKSAAAVLPGVYRRMLNDGTLERRVVHNQYQVVEKLAAAAVRAEASRLTDSHGLEKEAVQRRCQLASLRGHSVPAKVEMTEKTAHDQQAVEELARGYAVYKLSALHRIAASDSDFLLTSRISACQNQVV